MASGTYFLGLILIVALTARGEKAESTFFDDVEDQIAADSENALSLSLPATQGQQVERRLSLEDFFLNRNNQQNQQQQQQQAVEQQVQQLPLPQFQVQQPDPNSVLLVRDSQFPSANGGLISRLLMARRMLRLRRWARRLRFIPQLLGLGSQQPIRQASEHQPVVLLNSRVGRSYDDNYDPRDYVFGNKAHSYNSSLPSREKSYDREYEKPRKNDYSSETKPYYDTVNDLPYNLYEHSDVKPAKNYETEDVIVQNQNHQNQALNLIDTGSHANNQLQTPGFGQDIQQQLLYLQSLQQKLPQLVHHPNNQNQNYNQQQTHTGQIQPHNTQSEQYNHNNEIYNNNQQEVQQANQYNQNKQPFVDSNHYEQLQDNNKYQQDNQYNQNKQPLVDSNHYEQLQDNNKYQQANQNNQNKQPLVDSNHYEQLQDNNKYQQDSPVRDQSHQANLDQQLKLLREQQYQLAREQQFQLAREQQLKQLQQLQLLQQTQNQLQQHYNQQTQNYNQPQKHHNQQSNVVSNEQLYNYQQQSYQQQIQNPQPETQEIQGDRTENAGYETPLLNIGATNLQSGTRAGSSGNSIGVGVNVGLLPPAIDIAVSKPTASGIKPLPPIINPIGPKPIPVQPVQEHLVPIGFLPKPILNLNGRLFFGAELGKGVNIGR